MAEAESIFDKIKSIQDLYLRDYLPKLIPGGTWEGERYVAASIAGGKGHSFSFSLKKAVGADYAVDGRGKDIIDLVREIKGGTKLEAAKFLETEWGTEKPSLQLVTAKKKSDPVPVHPIPKDQELVINSWWTSQKGEVLGRWLYHNIKGEAIGWVVRFSDASAKAVPFQWCGKDGWRSIGFAEPRPLYNLQRLKEKGTILIVEGEKCADAATRLFPSLVSITWPGGSQAVKKSDWSVLQGKGVIIWRDNDKPGKKAETELCSLLSKLDCRIRILSNNAFENKPEGWDVADYAEEGNSPHEALDWLKNHLTEYQRGGADEPPSQEPNKSAIIINKPLNDYYRILGQVKNDYVFYNFRSGQVIFRSCEKITKKFMLSLSNGNAKYWIDLYGFENDKGELKIDWDSAAGALMAESHDMGQFDLDRVRGTGCWIDGKFIVFNSGEFLYIEGKKYNISDFDSHFLYVKSKPVLKSMDKGLSPSECSNLLQLCDMFSWEYPVCGTLLAGWLMVAPICGALPWRPHIYITGMAGTGKSTIHDNLLARVLGDCAIVTLGDSTKAGLSQSVEADALPIVFDEIENDGKFDEMRNDMVLRMARYSSSSQKGKTLKGTGDQSGAKGYVMRSCFCFSSITPSVKHYADYSRITLLPLVVNHNQGNDKQVAHYKKIMAAFKGLMGGEIHDHSFSEKFITHANRYALRIMESYRVIKETAQLVIPNFNARIADQIGMLLAGYWAYKSGKPITQAEAKELLSKYNWEDIIPSKKQENQMVLVSRLMQHKIRFRNEEKEDTREITRTVAKLLDYVSHNAELHPDRNYYKQDKAKELLQDIGIRYETDRNGIGFVFVANSSHSLSYALLGTQWSNNWGHSLKAIQGAESVSQPKWFGKSIGYQRCTMVPLEVFISNEN